uniref:Uncharacterized protein n=1 Tax=Arundo donax TaxID=35708 RepID=A0A0A9BY78_ARUDO
MLPRIVAALTRKLWGVSYLLELGAGVYPLCFWCLSYLNNFTLFLVGWHGLVTPNIFSSLHVPDSDSPFPKLP